MILVHTLFVLSVIAGFGLVVAAPQSSDTAAKDGASTSSSEPPSTAKAEESTTTETPKAEPPKDATKTEGEKKGEGADGARSVAAKMLKDGIETSGDKIVSDESLNSAVDKIVEIIQGERSGSSKAEALPLSLGEKFDFLLLKIPKISGTKDVKKDEEPIKKEKEKPKDADVLSKDQGGARNLGDSSPPSANPLCLLNGCNNCPCPQPNYPAYQPQPALVPTESLSNQNYNQEYIEPNCAQAQQQQQLFQQQQQMLQQQQQMLQHVSYRSAGANDYDSGSRALDIPGMPGIAGNYAQQSYLQPLQIQPNSDLYGYANNYFTRLPYYQNSLDAYGTPYPYIASLYPEAQPAYNSNWNNNMNLYGYHKR